jgi:hypothetical protein
MDDVAIEAHWSTTRCPSLVSALLGVPFSGL